MDKRTWEEKSRAAFEDYINDLKTSLGPEASFRDIEKAMLKFSPEMMRKTAEALANAEDFSPEEESNT
jgi:hypothetical protein